jgi:hypothetical protein
MKYTDSFAILQEEFSAVFVKLFHSFWRPDKPDLATAISIAKQHPNCQISALRLLCISSVSNYCSGARYSYEDLLGSVAAPAL